MPLEQGNVTANGIEFAYLAAGPPDGPLALCFHGFPDTAHTYRHLLPALADRGYRAVAPFLRGYAPTQVPPDGRYQSGALVADANALHEALGGDERAVVVGHDWGATAAHGTAVTHPERWTKVVTMAVPAGPALATGFFDYDQIKLSFYMYFFQGPIADFVVARNDLDFVARLWADWSPGYDSTEDLVFVRQSIGAQPNLQAALGYYRAMLNPARATGDLATEQQGAGGVPAQPVLYLHGRNDGCIGVNIGQAMEGRLAEGSDVVIVEDAGHFLHLEKPAEVNALILDFLAR